MPKDYISEQELGNLMEDLAYKLKTEDVAQVLDYLEQVIADTETQEQYIDRTYLTKIRNQKRKTKIAEITSLLQGMSDEQIENVRVYTVDEYSEPNHEAAALDAIIRLSKEHGKQVEE